MAIGYQALRDTSFRPTLVGSEVRPARRGHPRGRVSDQPSWGRRCPPPTSMMAFSEFQTNPRGVGGITIQPRSPTTRVSDQPSWGRRQIRDTARWGTVGFQTNPRGVGGSRTRTRTRCTTAFQTNPRGVGGSRTRTRTRCTTAFQTNPRGVGGETALRGEFRLRSFRPTLVGSEVRVVFQSHWSTSSFQTNPRGVGGHYHHTTP